MMMSLQSNYLKCFKFCLLRKSENRFHPSGTLNSNWSRSIKLFLRKKKSIVPQDSQESLPLVQLPIPQPLILPQIHAVGISLLALKLPNLLRKVNTQVLQRIAQNIKKMREIKWMAKVNMWRRVIGIMRSTSIVLWAKMERRTPNKMFSFPRLKISLDKFLAAICHKLIEKV